AAARNASRSGTSVDDERDEEKRQVADRRDEESHRPAPPRIPAQSSCSKGKEGEPSDAGNREVDRARDSRGNDEQREREEGDRPQHDVPARERLATVERKNLEARARIVVRERERERKEMRDLP